MKKLLITVSILLSVNAFATEKKSENKRGPSSITNPTDTVYILKRTAVVGCANKLCKLNLNEMVITSPILGMNLDADEALGQLEYSKLYGCLIKGGVSYGTKLFKAYEVSSCTEMSSREFTNKISDKYGG
jgi:hypothetical protein